MRRRLLRLDRATAADPELEPVRLWQQTDDAGYDETGRSDVLDVTAAELQGGVDWP